MTSLKWNIYTACSKTGHMTQEETVNNPLYFLHFVSCVDFFKIIQMIQIETVVNWQVGLEFKTHFLCFFRFKNMLH